MERDARGLFYLRQGFQTGPLFYKIEQNFLNEPYHDWIIPGPQCSLTRASKRSKSTGFLMNPSTRISFSGSEKALKATIGTFLDARSVCNALANSQPFMTGIMRSRRIRLGAGIPRRISIPSFPFEAVYTRYPSHSKASLRIVRMSDSSSISRMFMEMFWPVPDARFTFSTLPAFYLNFNARNNDGGSMFVVFLGNHVFTGTGTIRVFKKWDITSG
jgi:hypothetical protein